jgi:hypothetical protein
VTKKDGSWGSDVVYGKRFRMYCVKLIRSEGSLNKVRKILQQEIFAGKWPYENAPTLPTLSKWDKRYEPSYEVGDDPLLLADIDTLSMLRALQYKIRAGIRNLEFANFRELIVAMQYTTNTRRELQNVLKEHHVKVDEQSKGIINKIKRMKRVDSKTKIEMRDKAIDFIKARDELLDHKEDPRGRKVASSKRNAE